MTQDTDSITTAVVDGHRRHHHLLGLILSDSFSLASSDCNTKLAISVCQSNCSEMQPITSALLSAHSATRWSDFFYYVCQTKLAPWNCMVTSSLMSIICMHHTTEQAQVHGLASSITFRVFVGHSVNVAL